MKADRPETIEKLQADLYEMFHSTIVPLSKEVMIKHGATPRDTMAAATWVMLKMAANQSAAMTDKFGWQNKIDAYRAQVNELFNAWADDWDLTNQEESRRN